MLIENTTRITGRAPSLVDLCIQSAIDNIQYIGDVGETDLGLLKVILGHCTSDQLMFIEDSSEGRDLSPITDGLWRKCYERRFGAENVNVVVKRMKQKRVTFKWRFLYQAKQKEQEEIQQKSLDRLKQLCAKAVVEKQSRQIQICSTIPPVGKKRKFTYGGSGSNSSFSNVKGRLMKKAKMEYVTSHEARIHAAINKNSLQAASHLVPRGRTSNVSTDSGRSSSSMRSSYALKNSNSITKGSGSSYAVKNLNSTMKGSDSSYAMKNSSSTSKGSNSSYAMKNPNSTIKSSNTTIKGSMLPKSSNMTIKGSLLPKRMNL
eukprot:Gb_04539 [translate_table: standard]